MRLGSQPERFRLTRWLYGRAWLSAERREADWRGFRELTRDLERGGDHAFTVVRWLRQLYEAGAEVPRPPLEAGDAVGLMTIHAAKGLEWPVVVVPDLARGYDSKVTREILEVRGLLAEISEKGKPAPLAATKCWVVERTNSWKNAHKKLVWCTERSDRVIDFWLAFSGVIITVGRLIRQAWGHYRWESRPRRRP